MLFEWDPIKSKQNEAKHGISFEVATEIWQSTFLVALEIAYSKDGESRSATVGLAKGGIYTAIWTMRDGKIRLISVRRSRNGEEKVYWEKVFQE